MKAVGADGLAFAVPIDDARAAVAELAAAGGAGGAAPPAPRPLIGVAASALGPGALHELRAAHPGALPPSLAAALLVRSVSQGSPAHAAGLQPGDLLPGYGSERALAGELRARLAAGGGPLRLEVLRVRPGGGPCERLEVSVTPREL